MEIDIFDYKDNWQAVKQSAMNTIGKDDGKYPNSRWKKQILRCEHSPIRRIKFFWRWKDIPYWVAMHLVRHKVGCEWWVSTQRTDRTGINRDELPQGSLVNLSCEADAQALISISRKRLCNQASPETRKAWTMLKNKVGENEPEIANSMVPECIYRGYCPEMKPCGFADTEQFKHDLEQYRSLEA